MEIDFAFCNIIDGPFIMYCTLLILCWFRLIGIETTKSKNSKTNGKKGGSGTAGRKALNDITNKSSLHHPEAPVKKRNLPKEDINAKTANWKAIVMFLILQFTNKRTLPFDPPTP